jgi:hypothetical protein
VELAQVAEENMEVLQSLRE